MPHCNRLSKPGGRGAADSRRIALPTGGGPASRSPPLGPPQFTILYQLVPSLMGVEALGEGRSASAMVVE